MKILHLTLKREYFNEIAWGLKLKEYREIKNYWTKRLMIKDKHNIKNLKVPHWEPIKFNEIWFRNGYAKDRPFMRVEWKGLEYDLWQGKTVYAIKLGKILEIKNWSKNE